jgi:hypothetical protein
VAHRTAEPVELPNDQRVAGTQIGERFGQPRPIGLRAGRMVVEDALASGGVQRVMLERQLLVAG